MSIHDLQPLNTARQERYLKAVELLDSSHTHTRLGAVHALVALADEYLTDHSLTPAERHTEGQRIVDVLCAYIRSPFELGSHHHELIREESHLRQTILGNISKRLRWSLKDGLTELPNGCPEQEYVVPGNWSELSYDFAGSVFFYPVDFVRTFWGKPANFTGCTYLSTAQFSGSFFAQNALFNASRYREDTAFNGCHYAEDAEFSGSFYHGDNDFMGCHYREEVSFRGSVFDGWVGFSGSSYEGPTDFSGSVYCAGCDFGSSRYERQALWGDSFYFGPALFRQSEYRADTDFGFSVYADQSDFSGSIFHGAVRYLGSVYAQTVNAGTCKYAHKPFFVSGADRDDAASIFGSGQNTFAGVEVEDLGLPAGCWFMTSTEVEHLRDQERELTQILEEIRYTADACKFKSVSERVRKFLRHVFEWRESATQVGDSSVERPMSAPDVSASADTAEALDAWFREHMSPEEPY